jgi:hypothetical protein
MSSYYMDTLGVTSVQEWADIAEKRPANLEEETLERIGRMGEKMLAIMRVDSFEADEEVLKDNELLLTGRMGFDEHRAFLKEKYKD